MNESMGLLAPALADALVQFVWQGAAIGLLAWAALALLRDARPQSRYAVACLALLSCLLVPLSGLLQALAAGDAPTPVRFDAPLAIANGIAAIKAGGGGRGFGLPGLASPWIVAAWAAGVAALSLRMACGLLWVGRLRRSAHEDGGGAWQSRIDRLAARLGLRRPVALRLIDGDGSPLAAGWWRPVVLLPVAVATRMPVELVEALLAHELAHVRRHDYLVNVLQGVVEALLFYHPVVWWLSRRIRVERELVADDIAACALGDRRRLALALSELDRLVLDRFVPAHPDAFPSHLAPAAHGGQLMSRIQQLIRPQRRNPGALFALPLVGVALAGVAFYAQAHLATPQAAITAPLAADAPAPAAAPLPATAAAAPAVAPAAAPAAAVAPAAAPAAPAALPAPAAKPGAAVLPAIAPGRDDSYAFVRKGEAGIAMSGNVEDVDDIEAARDAIDGDFLWFRRDGKAWVVRDAATVARAREAWTDTREIEKEMRALETRMKPHEAKMKALGERMRALDVDDPMASPEGKAAMREIESLAGRMESVADRQVELALRQHRAGEAGRAALARQREQLASERKALDAELERRTAMLAELNKHATELAASQHAVALQMHAAGEPMHALGKQMHAVGERIQHAAGIADRQVWRLIDEAYRDGRAEPSPALR